MRRKKATRRGRVVRVPLLKNIETGEVHRVQVTIPAKVFGGTWRVSQTEPHRSSSTAHLSCGPDHRVMVRWSKRARDMGALIRGMTYAIMTLGGASGAELKKCVAKGAHLVGLERAHAKRMHSGCGL